MSNLRFRNWLRARRGRMVRLPIGQLLESRCCLTSATFNPTTGHLAVVLTEATKLMQDLAHRPPAHFNVKLTGQSNNYQGDRANAIASKAATEAAESFTVAANEFVPWVILT